MDWEVLVRIFTWLLIICISQSAWSRSVDKSFGKVVLQCEIPWNEEKGVEIFEQWHLSPDQKSISKPSRSFKQFENQMAIYSQIKSWVDAREISTVVAEGCEGPIDSQFKKIYNGWGYDDLKKVKGKKKFEEALAHIPLKLEVRYGDKIKTVCGDSNKLIKENNLAFSDIRGYLGFLQRIEGLKERPKEQEKFVSGARDILKLPKHTKDKKVVQSLRCKIYSRVKDVEQGFNHRNEHFVKAIQTESKPSVLVIGGAHVHDLVKKLDQKKIPCRVIRPNGYIADALKMVDGLKKTFEKECKS